MGAIERWIVNAVTWCSTRTSSSGTPPFERAADAMLADYGLLMLQRSQGAVEITDEMCAAALKAERSQRWNSDELRVWAMLAAARDAASTRCDGRQ